MRLEIIFFLIALAIFIYIKFVGKIPIPKVGGINRFVSIINGAWAQTALLLLLFLLTLSYAVGGREEWRDSLRWWWNSKIFLPSLLAVIGTIFFVDAKWRKKINNALIFATGAMILFSLLMATPAITGLLEGGNKDKKGEAPASQNVAIKPAEEVQKTKEVTILAEYGAFTGVPLPPTEKLIHIRWEVPPEYGSQCLVAIEQEGNPEMQVFPCEQDKPFSEVIKIWFSSNDPQKGVPVTVTIIYLEAE